MTTKGYVDSAINSAVSAAGGGGVLKIYQSDGVTLLGNFIEDTHYFAFLQSCNATAASRYTADDYGVAKYNYTTLT